jgi:predicted permease
VDILSLFAAVAPVFLMVVAGYAMRRAGWLTTEADSSLLRVVVNLLYPCLILHKLLGNPAIANPSNLVLAPLVGFLLVALGYAACYAAAPLFGIRESVPRRTFAFTAGLQNYGYIALPVVQKLFVERPGQPADEGAMAVLFVHNVGVEAALWTLGIMLLTRTSPRQGWRRILSVPLVAIAVAVGLNFTGANHWLPSFAQSAIWSLGDAAIPLGLVLTGAVFADQMQGKEARATPGAVGWAACALRIAILPALMLAVARYLPLPRELRQVVLVQAAMPSAVIPVILAKHYGGDAPVALRIVLVTSLVGLLTIPLWLKVGLLWIGAK